MYLLPLPRTFDMATGRTQACACRAYWTSRISGAASSLAPRPGSIFRPEGCREVQALRMRFPTEIRRPCTAVWRANVSFQGNAPSSGEGMAPFPLDSSSNSLLRGLSPSTKLPFADAPVFFCAPQPSVCLGGVDEAFGRLGGLRRERGEERGGQV